MPDKYTNVAEDRSDNDRREGSCASRRKTNDPAMTKMFEELGFVDERKGDRRTVADRRDEENVRALVTSSGKGPGYIE